MVINIQSIHDARSEKHQVLQHQFTATPHTIARCWNNILLAHNVGLICDKLPLNSSVTHSLMRQWQQIRVHKTGYAHKTSHLGRIRVTIVTVEEQWVLHVLSRGELSYLAPLGSENISAPYFKQCFFQGWGDIPPRQSNTTPPSPKKEINILFYILNFASIIKFKM